MSRPTRSTSPPSSVPGAAIRSSGRYPANACATDSTSSRRDPAPGRVTTVDVSELQKAEGAVTCCSLVFDAVPAAGVTVGAAVPA
jgi:hypothetical protein